MTRVKNVVLSFHAPLPRPVMCRNKLLHVATGNFFALVGCNVFHRLYF